MTYEEALEICNTAIKYFTLKHYDEQNEFVKDLAKRADIVFMANAIEKQIPKKVIFDKNEQIWKNKCPNCNAGYLELEYLTEKYRFCIRCGQRLDWSENE